MASRCVARISSTRRVVKILAQSFYNNTLSGLRQRDKPFVRERVNRLKRVGRRGASNQDDPRRSLLEHAADSRRCCLPDAQFSAEARLVFFRTREQKTPRR